MALHNMEKRFVETNMWQCEINRVSRLPRLTPRRSLTSRKSAAVSSQYRNFTLTCSIRGRIGAASARLRLTIPCISGRIRISVPGSRF